LRAQLGVIRGSTAGSVYRLGVFDAKKLIVA